jgi:hypothetical protein
MDVSAKLQIKPGSKVAILAAPDDGPQLTGSWEAVADPASADVVIVFAKNRDDLASAGAPAIDAARADRLTWIAYPKAGQLGTDLNRDKLRESLDSAGIQPVRQVAIDEVWSALRFRPALYRTRLRQPSDKAIMSQVQGLGRT